MRMRRAVLAILIVAAATARGDCIIRSYEALRSCVESHGSANDCYNDYIRSAGACGWKIGAPGQPPFGFPTTYVGGHQQYLPQYQNPYGDTATIYASFTPWHNGHNGYFSPADLGPFTISNFQRRELKGGEKQKLLVSFDPKEAGPYQARLYVWLDHRGGDRSAATASAALSRRLLEPLRTMRAAGVRAQLSGGVSAVQRRLQRDVR